MTCDDDALLKDDAIQKEMKLELNMYSAALRLYWQILQKQKT